jgi:hypothetical protein
MTPARRRLTTVVRRWPTALAVGMSALTMDPSGADSSVEAYGEILPFLALLYLIVAALRRRGASWPVLIAGFAGITVLELLGVVAPSSAAVAVALVVLVWSAVSGRLTESGTLRVQALGMLGFGALALIGLAVDPQLGRYVVAAGWFLHGIWDFVHLRLDRVVSRSYAEWCGVVDVLVAAELLLLG